MTLDLDRLLVTKLQERGVRIDVSDANTVALKNVPAHAQRFTKERTNVLMQRPRAGLPFILGVDEDLDYVGPDPALARLFASGLHQRGWRVLRLDLSASDDFQVVVERALRVIGFDGREPELESGNAEAPGRPPLGGTNLTRQLADGTLQPTVGRGDQIEAVVASLLQRHKRLPVITGESGIGKTNLLHGVARRLAAVRSSFNVFRVDLSETFTGTLFDAERENAFASLLTKGASPDRVLCLEHIELVRLAMPEGPLVLEAALEEGASIVGTTHPGAAARLQTLPFKTRLQVICLDEPDQSSATSALIAHRDALAAHHRVSIDDEVVSAAVARAGTLEGVFPGKGISLLDAAASRAALARAPAIELAHIYLAAADFEESEK
jgi:hypothetical protein